MKLNRRFRLAATFLVILSMLLPVSALAADQNWNFQYSGRSEDRVSFGHDVAVANGANGDIVTVLGSTKVKGNVNGDVVAVGGSADIDGKVAGDVIAIGGKAILRGQTVVAGDVVSSSIEKSADAVILGDTVQLPIPYFGAPNGMQGAQFWQGLSFLGRVHDWFKIGSLIAVLVIMILVVAAYPSGVETIERSVEKDTLRSLAVGFIASLLFIPIAITIIGIPVVIFLVLAAKFLGYAGVCLFIGKRFVQGVKWNTDSLYHLILAGGILAGLVSFVPFLGGLVGLVLFWISLGAMLDTRFGTGRPWFNKTL